MSEYDIFQKLEILTDAAKYDVACTSSGVDRPAVPGKLGSAVKAGICHSFAADGRCISLLKVLMSNDCAFDCTYCVNRRSTDCKRASFTPKELCELTMQFYRRNYIEGLFLSSAVVKNPDYTCELMLSAIRMLREDCGFWGYVHIKAIPGASPRLTEQLGRYADRMSVNIELPSHQSLRLLAPQKSKEKILTPMAQIRDGIAQNSKEIVKYRAAPRFVPAGQSTQMIIGASPETDRQILNLTEGLYKKYSLKRVFFSAYMPVVSDRALPALDTPPPLLREHRLYQADWLLRYYGFETDELLSEEKPDFNLLLDPKCDWALRHLDRFPVEVMQADYHTLLRVPGIGYRSAGRIVKARRLGTLDYGNLKKMGVVLKRAVYFITCGGKQMYPVKLTEDDILRNILDGKEKLPPGAGKEPAYEQLSLFDDPRFSV